MGVKQSKRSVDITETSTKGEIEGFGNEGKVEKIIDGVVEKVAANGHVDGDLQNGGEVHQNGVEPMQNGEAAAVAAEKVMEKKDIDESAVEESVNGAVENGEVNGEAEKSGEESKKSEDKKEKKKEKKVVKKKFSLRNFSFSKKDKTKPPKEEKSGKTEEIKEASNNEEKAEIASPSQEPTSEMPGSEESEKAETDTVTVVYKTAPEQPNSQGEQPSLTEVASNVTSGPEDLPPPLPASPPPGEPVDGKTASEVQEGESKSSGVDSSISDASTSEKMPEPVTEGMKDADQIAIETGKQIEEKVTSLLKTVEERAEESMRTGGEAIAEKITETVQNASGEVDEVAAEDATKVEEVATKAEEMLSTVQTVQISNLDSLAPKAEDSSEKHEEGAGESLADIPKDLAEEVTGDKMEAINPDSLEISATIPPPVLETAVTGE